MRQQENEFKEILVKFVEDGDHPSEWGQKQLAALAKKRKKRESGVPKIVLENLKAQETDQERKQWLHTQAVQLEHNKKKEAKLQRARTVKQELANILKQSDVSSQHSGSQSQMSINTVKSAHYAQLYNELKSQLKDLD